MFDGIKIQDVSVEADALLTNDLLTFGGLVDTQTGFILSPIRRAQDRGLNFQLIPRRTGPGYRVEVKGSLHKFYNNGLHNADQYTVNDLLLTMNRLATDYGFDLFNSKINNIEFGVNIELPFAISQVFNNLICHKNQPFQVDSFSQTPYYVCNWQRYSVKIYDKGKQKGLGSNLLRFEIRVRKMRYFDDTGVQLHTLADLLNVANYRPLGALLVDAFNDILFDDPAINPKALTAKERALYQQCRNPRYWHTPDGLTPNQAAAYRQQMSRNKDRFRALLSQHGSNWQREVSALIRQTWDCLTAVDDDLLIQIETYKTTWKDRTKPNGLNGATETKNSEETVKNAGATSHKLTRLNAPPLIPVGGKTSHKLTHVPAADLSQINPLCSEVLCSEVLCDEGKQGLPPVPGVATPDESTLGAVVCPVTGTVIDQPRPGQRFVSAVTLRNNDDLLLTLERQHGTYAKGSKEDLFSRAAHNVRNKESNERNNLRRRIDRFNKKKGGQQSLFPELDVFPLTDSQRAALDYWNGTPYEVNQ